MTGLTPEDVQKERDEVLSCGCEEIRALAPYLKAVLEQDCICVIGNEKKLEEHGGNLKRAAVDLAHKLAGELRDTEAALSKTSELMGAVVQYAKTRPVFDGYKAARYSRKYLAQHEAELADYRAAKAAMSELLGGAKLPKMDTLKKQHRELSEKKKALYAEYRKAQADMRQAVAVKANIDHLLGHADEQKNKAQER